MGLAAYFSPSPRYDHQSSIFCAYSWISLYMAGSKSYTQHLRISYVDHSLRPSTLADSCWSTRRWRSRKPQWTCSRTGSGNHDRSNRSRIGGCSACRGNQVYSDIHRSAQTVTEEFNHRNDARRRGFSFQCTHGNAISGDDNDFWSFSHQSSHFIELDIGRRQMNSLDWFFPRSPT